MGSTNKTPSLKLSQYTDSDKPTYRGDYNSDMNKIDAKCSSIDSEIVNVNSKITNVSTDANTALSVANTAKSIGEAAKVVADSATTGVADAKSAATAAAATANAAAPKTTVYTKSEVYTRVESDSRYPAKGSGQALFIGDSFGSGMYVSVTERFPAVISAMLGYAERNYCVGGSGISAGGSTNNYLAQAKRAKADNVSPEIIFIVGCQNDSVPVAAAAQSLGEYLAANFPKVPVVAVPGIFRSSVATDNLHSRVADWCEGLSGYAKVVLGAHQWLQGRNDLMIGDGMHPNPSAHVILAKRIISALSGGEHGVTLNSIPMVKGPKVTTFDMAVRVNSGWATLSGAANLGSNVAAGDVIGTIPLSIVPNTKKFFLGYTLGGQTGLTCSLEPDGTIKAVSVISNGGLAGNYIVNDFTWYVGR